MRRIASFLCFLAVSAALAPGTPMPRAVAIGREACEASRCTEESACEGACPTQAGCGECPVRPARQADEPGKVRCEVCVCCSCGVAVAAALTHLEDPLADARTFDFSPAFLTSISIEPPLPPPKRLG